MSIDNLQQEKQSMLFIEWWLELCGLFAQAWGIDKILASKRLNEKELQEWHEDGFSPYVTFRENYKPLI